MPRPCGPCGDKSRNDLDRRLLGMPLSGESYRLISTETGYSETALRRHKDNHLSEPVADVLATMKRAREETLAEIKARERESLNDKVAESMASRLNLAADSLMQLREVRSKAADLLDLSEASQDLRAAAMFCRELRWLIRLGEDLRFKDPAGEYDTSLLDAITQGSTALFEKFPLDDPMDETRLKK